MKDIVPELLEIIEKEFANKIAKSKKLSRILNLIKQGKATYKEANEYSIEAGEILADVFKKNISSDLLPDGKMYFNIANRILNPTMKELHESISSVSANIQTELNHSANLGIQGIEPPLNQDRIDGLVNRLSSENHYDDVAWMLDENIVNFSQSIVDDTIKTNSEFHAKSGLKPKIIRRSTGKCCDWCDAVAGTYEYPDVPKDVYRRHRFCKCTVDYYPGDGKRINVHSKRQINKDRSFEIDKRKVIGLRANKTTVTGLSSHIIDRMEERNLSMESIKNAIEKPLKVGPVVIDEKGRPAFKMIGYKATIYINPESGIITTVHPTHSKTAQKLLKEKKE